MEHLAEVLWPMVQQRKHDSPADATHYQGAMSGQRRTIVMTADGSRHGQQRTSRAAAALAAVAVGLGVVAVGGWLPGADDAAARAALQSGLLAAAAALLAVAGGLVALVETRRANEHTHVRELYTRAIDQLGSEENATVRLGGIYALERIAKDSPGDKPTVAKVLAAFIRENTMSDRPGAIRRLQDRPASALDSDPTADGEEGWTGRVIQLPALDIDIQAALTVLTQPPMTRPRLELTGCDLVRADLRKADLSEAVLMFANLAGSWMTGAKLTRTTLAMANLTHAWLLGADLTDAMLAGAKLVGADLGGCEPHPYEAGRD
ncbi:pentapeptide repeat-containing protein [Parafrankia sp. FMc2]|uniref:pentapeptide repeat-containing protein n=1 Tax=Parafrankia sp. FMc2 TaxID=3233196 RepID=UPI0034D71D47